MGDRYEGQFKGHQNSELFYQTWSPEESRGTIVVTHGLAEHSECYHRFAQSLNNDNWTVIGWDLRGHGRSQGKRGYVGEFTHFEEDLCRLLHYVQEDLHKDQGHLVLFGHSMGGLISLRTVMNHGPMRLSALCLSSPCLGLAIEVPKLKEKLAEIASDWAPKLTMANEITYDQLVRDRELIREYERDPLRHDKISPRMFLGMKNAFDEAHERAPEIDIPFLLQLAGKEVVVSTPASQAFYERVKSQNKELHVYEESYHEIFNDLDRETVLKDFKSFINQL